MAPVVKGDAHAVDQGFLPRLTMDADEAEAVAQTWGTWIVISLQD